MATPISALERQPLDLIREVSPEAINFYVDELSGIYLPQDFKQEHAEIFGVKCWEAEDRLRGKFGRFALRHAQEEDEQTELPGILIIGTTIGLSGLDRYGRLASLRHYSLQDKVQDILEERNLIGADIGVDPVDYGDTTIVVTKRGKVDSIKVHGSSIDFGRAKAEGRQQTCELFERLLGDSAEIINVDPDPEELDRIIR